MGRPSSNYPPELRERAVRLVEEVRPEYPSDWAADRGQLVHCSKFENRLRVQRKANASKSHGLQHRRLRISAIHNELRAHIPDCDFIFGIEDDGVFLIIGAHRTLVAGESGRIGAGIISSIRSCVGGYQG
jgi:hypothetical protein